MRSYAAFLRIRHPSIDPDELSHELGLAPAHAWAAGSARRAAGGGATVARPDTYWIAELNPGAWDPASLARALPFAWPVRGPVPLELVLFAQLRLLRPKRVFLKRLIDEGGQIDIALTLDTASDDSMELSASALRAFAELGIGLSIELGTEPQGEPGGNG